MIMLYLSFSLYITLLQLGLLSNSKAHNLSTLSASRLRRVLLTPFEGTPTTASFRMADEGRPEQRYGDLFAILYQKPKPFKRGSVLKIRTKRISKFKNYGELELYLFEKCGGGHRVYPGGADYPVITYTKYDDEDAIERELRTEPWESFAASVYHILVKRVEA